TYALWVNSLDYEKNQPGSRYFHVICNDTQIDKRFGTHGHDGFRWELADKIHLRKGVNRFQLLDASAFYARCDGLFLTKDLNMSAEDVITESRNNGAINFKSEPLGNPTRIGANARVLDTLVLENDRMKLLFYQLGEGKQRHVETEVFFAGTRVKPRSESDALILLRANESQLYYDKGFPIFRSKIVDEEGNLTTALAKSPYESYQKDWLIPASVVRISANAV